MSTIAPARLASVLIVDDTPTVRLLLRHCLSASGRFEVVGEAVDGSDAISRAEQQQPDIILLDLAMPVMDGLEAIPHLTICSPRSRIIVLSGFSAEATADRAMHLGAHAYIEKRHRPDELLRRIADAWEVSGGAPGDEPAPDRSSNGDLADLVAVAAHDLKAPLQAILGSSELLASTYVDQLDDQGRELLTTVVAAGRSMEELLDGLLAYCRPGPADLQVADADLDEILAAVRTDLNPQIEAAYAIVTTDPLPRVHGDPAQLQKLFRNLMANALTFTRPGVTPRIHVSAQRLDDAWVVSMADNGIGIDRTQPGIGLAICQRIAERHRGAIWVEDTPGGGSRFVVRLPGPQVEPWADDDTTASPDARSRSGPLNVLLVEDSPEHAKLVAALLLAAQNPVYHLTSVATLSEAVVALRTMDLDCVLLDLSLPDAEGLESLAQVRAEVPTIPVVVITSSSDETLAFTAVKEGAQDYLVKGRIDAEQLSRSIRWAVQRKALERDLARAAWRDPLTKLANRTLLLDRLRGALARAARSGDTVALLYLDLDDFKAVNDHFGHDVGDRVLVAVAQRLNHNIRPQDTAARLGGDEFVVLCEGLEDAGSDVGVVRSRLEGAIEMPIIDGDGLTLQVRASIGAATSDPSDAADTLMRRADESMYQTKENRRR